MLEGHEAADEVEAFGREVAAFEYAFADPGPAGAPARLDSRGRGLDPDEFAETGLRKALQERAGSGTDLQRCVRERELRKDGRDARA